MTEATKTDFSKLNVYQKLAYVRQKAPYIQKVNVASSTAMWVKRCTIRIKYSHKSSWINFEARNCCSSSSGITR